MRKIDLETEKNCEVRCAREKKRNRFAWKVTEMLGNCQVQR